jgi:hypothetical protein
MENYKIVDGVKVIVNNVWDSRGILFGLQSNFKD